ncbi:MAG: M42 family peptidase [Oscillospiraceae bacterium]
MVNIDMIKELTLLSGVSGNEHDVRDYIIGKIQGKCEYTVDPLGNILAFKKGKKDSEKRIMFSAHMDEVGFLITYIEDSGLLKFTNVGGIDSRVVIGKTVRVNGLYGVIGTKAVHMQTEDEREKPVKMDNLYIDIGAKTKEEAMEKVCVGDRATFESDFFEFGASQIKGKALDDRIGCYMLIEMINSDLEYDTHFAFTVNEETGMQGAASAAYTVAPDISVVLEATTAADIPDIPPHKTVCGFKKGGVLSFMDRATVYDFDLYKFALNLAKENSIPCQSKEGVFGGNEARCIQTTRGGVKVLALSLPCRYLHSPSCVLDKEDIENTLKLAKLLANELQSF